MTPSSMPRAKNSSASTKRGGTQKSIVHRARFVKIRKDNGAMNIRWSFAASASEAGSNALHFALQACAIGETTPRTKRHAVRHIRRSLQARRRLSRNLFVLRRPQGPRRLPGECFTSLTIGLERASKSGQDGCGFSHSCGHEPQAGERLRYIPTNVFHHRRPELPGNRPV